MKTYYCLYILGVHNRREFLPNPRRRKKSDPLWGLGGPQSLTQIIKKVYNFGIYLRNVENLDFFYRHL